MDAPNVMCAQLTRDLSAIAKFLLCTRHGVRQTDVYEQMDSIITVGTRRGLIIHVRICEFIIRLFVHSTALNDVGFSESELRVQSVRERELEQQVKQLQEQLMQLQQCLTYAQQQLVYCRGW